jgi:hypothetical protein
MRRREALEHSHLRLNSNRWIIELYITMSSAPSPAQAAALLERVSASQPLHFDAAKGSDAAGLGTPEQPLQTLAHALFLLPAEHADYPHLLVRAQPDPAAPDAVAAYEPASKSQLKKAKAYVADLRKKLGKANEKEKKDADAAAKAKENDEKRLAEAKAIVLVQDPALPPAAQVRSRPPSLLPSCGSSSGLRPSSGALRRVFSARCDSRREPGAKKKPRRKKESATIRACKLRVHL